MPAPNELLGCGGHQYEFPASVRAHYDRTGLLRTLKRQYDGLYHEGTDPNMDGTNPILDVQMCCQAFSAECFACMEGMSVAQYCARHPKPNVCGGPHAIPPYPHDDSYESYSYGWWPEASPSPAPDSYESYSYGWWPSPSPEPDSSGDGVHDSYESYSYGWWPEASPGPFDHDNDHSMYPLKPSPAPWGAAPVDPEDGDAPATAIDVTMTVAGTVDDEDRRMIAHAFAALAGVDVSYVDVRARAVQWNGRRALQAVGSDPCACSGRVEGKEGCDDHLGDGASFCYVADLAVRVRDAVQRHPGERWRATMTTTRCSLRSRSASGGGAATRRRRSSSTLPSKTWWRRTTR